ncbi:MAG: choline-sulfatase, partial [Pseudomonadota bacterium]
NLDRLAASGAVFETAYCNYPLCAPSRASMATGQLCSAIGVYDNAAELPASIPTYAHYLRALGYQTALSGKMHFIGPDQHHGFEQRLTADLYPADFAWAPNWDHEGERDTNDPRSVLISGVCEDSIQINFDDEVTKCAADYLNAMASGGDDRPFFLQVSYTHPHEPYLCQRRHWVLYEDVEIPLPEIPALTEEEYDAHSLRTLRDFGMFEYPFSEEDIKRSRRAHLGAISYLDEKIGEVLDALNASGRAENTVIVFTSDHGEFLGERGMWFKKHFYEPSIRIPLLIAGPGFGPQRVDTPASLVDLLPTFCGIAGEADWSSDIEDLAGEDLSKFLAAPELGRTLSAEYLAEAALAPIYMLRQGRYKYIHSAADPAMLFDLAEDPHELANLAGDPAHANTVAGFEQEIIARWDDAALTRAIRLSQRRRGLIKQANEYGGAPRWNHGETAGQAVRWYRGEQGYNEWAFDYTPEPDGQKA